MATPSPLATTTHSATMASVRTAALVRSTQAARWAPIATTAAHARLHPHHQTARWAPTVPTAARAWCTRRLRHLLHLHLHLLHRLLCRHSHHRYRRHRRPLQAHLRAHLRHHLRGAPGRPSAAPIRVRMPTTAPVKMVGPARSGRLALSAPTAPTVGLEIFRAPCAGEQTIRLHRAQLRTARRRSM